MKSKLFYLFIYLILISINSFAQSSDPCHDEGNNEGNQGPDKNSIGIRVVKSYDPNVIIGTPGYDTTKKWVSVNSILSYKILFENSPDFATAPAQNVTIYMPIQAKLNPNSIRLGDFGFGSFVFNMPPNTTSFTTRLDLVDSLGVLVDVTAGLDITNNRAFWVFQSIDPVTGLSSTLSPNTGFLPINDTAKGNGEGFVSLTLQPVSTAKTQDTTSGKASIIFDQENPIPTNSWRNTVDAVAPTSKVNPVSSKSNTTALVTWSGKDDTLGVGLKSYSLYVSENNGPFAPYITNTDSTQIIFNGIKGNKYGFYTRATDFTGNTEAQKTVADQTFVMGQVIVTSVFFYRDADNDGYGDPTKSILAGKVPPGYVTNNKDCDDSNASVHPGATELCNGIDDNCNGETDEGCGPSKPPIITLTIPSNDTLYTGPAKIYLSATASDPDGTIKKVQFYNGTTLLHTEHEYPYGFGWYNVPVGNYTLTAKAIDNDSNVTASNSINVSVVANKAPSVNLILPAGNVTYGSPASVYLNATASDEDGYIQSVAFYNGSTLLHTEYVAPYGYIWKDILAGNYIITAVATDNSGLSSTSTPVQVSIVTSATPIVSITSPADNAVFTSNASIEINATASDPDGVSKVEFYNGTTLLHTEYHTAYTYIWNNVPTGNYTLTVKSINKNGVTTTSNSIHISVVDNTAPTVNIITPINNQVFQAPVIIGLKADAKDNDGAISKVEFYVDGNLLTTEYSYPYRYLWRDVQPSIYTITAKAIDNSGAVTTSQDVTISVIGAGETIVTSKSNTADTVTASKANLVKANLSNELLELKLSPNPVHKILYITINGQKNKPAELYLISASGVAIKNVHSLTSNEVSLDVSSLVNGVYFIKVINGGKVMYKQFVKL